MGTVGRSDSRIAVFLLTCWLLLIIACLNRGPMQWILCGTAVLGMVGTLVAAIVWPHSPQRLLVTVTGYRCDQSLVQVTGTVSVQGSEEVYRPEVTLELLDAHQRVVGAKSFWPTGQTRRHVQPGFVGSFRVSLTVAGDADRLVPRITCREYPCTVTWATVPDEQLAMPPLART
ncbi:MAG: hypothetical protein ACM3XN_08600 [Chloroflexota bacterium]